MVAGHSLGEYSALAAAGSLRVAECARLLRLRGEAMQRPCRPGEGAMAALLGTDLEAARAICAEAAQGEVVEAANDNGGGQVVISGHRTAVERAVELAKARGIKRAMLLPVSAPFHCALMAPAADVMARRAGHTARWRRRGAADRQRLGRQGDRPGRDPRVAGAAGDRHGALAGMRAGRVELGVDSFVELGAGKVLSGLVRRVAPDARAAAAGTPAEIEAVLKAL